MASQYATVAPSIAAGGAVQNCGGVNDGDVKHAYARVHDTEDVALGVL
jgi:hypothetical protein